MNLTWAIRNGKTKLFLFGLVWVLMGLGVAIFLAGDVYRYQDTVQVTSLPEVDAIVCLAGGRGRLSAASQIWYIYSEQAKTKSQKTPILYLSGVGPQASWSQLAWQLKPTQKSADHMISPADVVFENESLNTSENARLLLKYAQSQQWRRILLMTSSYHMKRAQFIFKHVLATNESPIEVNTLSVTQEPFTPEGWASDWNGARVTLFEYFKLIYYQWVWASL